MYGSSGAYPLLTEDVHMHVHAGKKGVSHTPLLRKTCVASSTTDESLVCALSEEETPKKPALQIFSQGAHITTWAWLA